MAPKGFVDLVGTATRLRRVSRISTLALGLALSGCGGDDPCSGGSRLRAGSVEITGVDGADRLEELECVQVITGDLSISDPEVNSLEALSSLVHVLGDVSIRPYRESKMKLDSLHGLGQLTEIGGSLEISDVDRLGSIEPLGALKSVGGGLELRDLPLLKSLDGLGALESIGGDLAIVSNDKLADLKALRSLAVVGGTLSLESNPRLTSASLLLAPTVAGIDVFQNDSLTRLDGFRTLQGDGEPCAGRRDDIHVASNSALERLVLQPSEKVCIHVSNNPRMTNLLVAGEGSGSLSLIELPKLTKLDLGLWKFDSLEIVNTGLETLEGLDLAEIDCVFEVSGNPQLQDASDVGYLSAMAALFLVTDNPKLPTCQVQGVLDELPATGRQCIAHGMTEGARRVMVSGNDDDAVCD
jgi:hypothetical protein